MKKIVSIISLVAVMLNMVGISVSANSTEVVLTGEVYSTIIDVDIPTTASFTVDPNVPEGDAERYVLPTLNVTNHTTAPITLTLTGFDNKAGSDNQFIEVARGDKEWEKIGSNDSTTYIYLGVTAVDNQSAFLDHTSLLSQASADLVQQENKELCNIKSGGTVTLDLECQTGSSFPSAITSVYDMTFVVSLYDGEPIYKYGLITDISIVGINSTPLPTHSQQYTCSVDIATAATIIVTTEREDTVFAINGIDYTGSQTINIDLPEWTAPDNGLITLIYNYQGTDVTVKYALY